MSKLNRSLFNIVIIERSSSVQLHRQIYEALRIAIFDGRLEPESFLPSTRALAKQLEVGRNTVIAAYEQLAAEGYVETRRGSRTHIVPLLNKVARATAPQVNPISAALSRRGLIMAEKAQPHRPAHTFNAQPAFPDIAGFPFLIWSRIVARNAQSHAEDLISYESFAGHPRLRQALAQYLGVARGVACLPEQIIIVTGAQAGLDLVTRLLIDPEDTVWLEEPGYVGARNAFLGSGATIEPLRVSREGWDLHDRDLTEPRLIYVTPSCQWPFGTIMRMEERLELLAIAQACKAWIIEDDYDGEYRIRGRPVPALRGLDGADRVVYIGTFGKTLLPSLRLAYIIVPLELADAVGRAISITGQFAPLLLQASVADFIQRGHFATHLNRMRRLYAQRQEIFVALCRAHLSRWLNVMDTDAGMQILGSFIEPFNDREVQLAALAHGLDVQPISMNYHFDKPEHGLLLGYAGLDELQMKRMTLLLKNTFEDLEREAAKLPTRVVP